MIFLVWVGWVWVWAGAGGRASNEKHNNFM